MRYILILFIAVISCNSSEKKKNLNQKNDIKIIDNKNLNFPKSKDLKVMMNRQGEDAVPFLLTYNKNEQFTFESINFSRVDLMLKSKDYLKTSIYFGIKADSLFVGEFYNSKINDVLFLFSMNDYSYPRQIKNTFIYPRRLDIKKVCEENDEKVFQIESFYDSPHSNLPRFTLYKFYLSKERGIFKVSVLDNKTKELFFPS